MKTQNCIATLKARWLIVGTRSARRPLPHSINTAKARFFVGGPTGEMRSSRGAARTVHCTAADINVDERPPIPPRALKRSHHRRRLKSCQSAGGPHAGTPPRLPATGAGYQEAGTRVAPRGLEERTAHGGDSKRLDGGGAPVRARGSGLRHHLVDNARRTATPKKCTLI